MKKIKLLIFLPHLIGGGAERVTVNIIKLLDKEVYDISLVVLSTQNSVYDLSMLDIKIIELHSSKTLFSILKLRQLIKDIDPDILFSTLFRGHIALNIALLFLSLKAKLVLRSPNSPKLTIENKQISFIQRKLLESSYNRADCVIAQTPEMKEEIIFYHGITEKKVKFFMNPLDTEMIDEKIEKAKNPFEIDCINIVAAGRIIKQKGFDVLINSFVKVVKQNQHFKLHIIGQDMNGEMNVLKKMIQDYDLGNNVFFLGYQSNPYQYYLYSDLYVLSSRWEGLPNTVLENLYLNKPVVSTRCIPFMDTLISEGENGFLVEVEDVGALADAILNYKKINMKFSKSNDSKKRVNELFLKIIKDSNETDTSS